MSMASIEVIQKQDKKQLKVKQTLESDKESTEDKDVPIDLKELNEI
jgi:hypothetical protein